MTPDPPAVLVRDLDVTYRVYEDRRPTMRQFVAGGLRPRSARIIHALRGVSLAVQPGECVGIVGGNGSGKSTLLRAVAGLLTADRGAVYARAQPVLLGVAAALQPELSGRRNILLGGAALRISAREMAALVDEIAAFAGLEDFLDVPIRAYSSGMSARLQFAIATTVRPEILLVDEALAVGDQQFQARSAARMAEVLAAAGTILLVSHNAAHIRSLCSRAVWLAQGVIGMEGEPDEIISAYAQAQRSPDAAPRAGARR